MKVRYSQASVIAEVVKEAYRDYLSASDKAFQQQQQVGAMGGRGNESKRDREGESIDPLAVAVQACRTRQAVRRRRTP